MIEPRSVSVSVRPSGKPVVRTFQGSAVWLAVPVVAVLLVIAGAFLTARVYLQARDVVTQHASLVNEVESLQRQNRRLEVLEAELAELRELQQQMLRLAGIETALGVDLDLLEELWETEAADSLPADPSLLVWPLEGIQSTGFTLRHPGIDIEAPRGQTIVAAGSGVVDEVGTDSRYGRRLVLKHFNEYTSVYANIALNLVEVGDTVRVGQIIGLVGAGREGGIPHLHFEVHKDGQPVEPAEHIHEGRSG